MNEALMFEQVVPPVETQKPWERQQNEPARWFLRFRRYLASGHTRSVNAVYEAEQQEKAGKSRGKAGETWYHAAKLYRWEERAAAYDANVLEQKALGMRALAVQSPFLSSSYRLWQLNSLADGVARIIEQGQPPETFLPLCKQLQSLMHDIAAEVAACGLSFDATCDAAALDAVIAKLVRLKEIEEQRKLAQETRLFNLARNLGEALKG